MLPRDRVSVVPKRGSPVDAGPRISLDLEDYELGGVALNDATQGSRVKLWKLVWVDDEFIVSAPGVAPEVLFTASNVTQVGLAFDRNMAPFVCFVQSGQAKFWWFDPTIPGYTITNLPAGSVTPRCTLDDKRTIAGSLDLSDIILAYARDGFLRYRQQRDRYLVEYTPPNGEPAGEVERTPSEWTSTGAYAPGLVPTVENLSDAAYNTGYGSAGTSNQWLQADLGAPVAVDRIVLAGGSLPGWGGVATYLNNRYVQWSNDGTTWTTAFIPTGITDGAPQEKEFTFSAITARYWRLTNIPGGGSYIATSEFRFYGFQAATGSPIPATEVQFIAMNSQNRLQFWIDGTSDEPWSLADIIEAEALTARFPGERLRFEPAMYTTIVPGCASSPEYSVDEFIAMLARVYFFDQQDSNGQAYFRFRGGPVVATIDEMDMVEGEDEVEEDTTRDSIQVPQLMHMMYMDEAGGLSADKQQSDRPLGARAEAPVVVSTPVVLPAQDAARAVRITHKIIEDQLRGTLKFGVPESFLRVTKADPVIVTYRGRAVRGRVIEEIIEEGWQRLEVERERQSAYTANIQPVPPAPITPPRPSIPGPTVATFANLPALVPANDFLGYHFAVSGVLAAWRGAVIERQTLGEFSILATDSVGTVMAELLDPLAAASEHYIDSTNVIRVSLVRADDQFDSVTEQQFLSGANAAAIIRSDGTGEVIQFRDADEVEPGVWELSRLVRGALNSKATAHADGALLVMLSGALFMPSGIERVGETITHLVYSYPELPSAGIELEDVFAPPLSQTEWPPVIATAAEDAGQVTVSWIPRHRFGRDITPFPSANFTGWRLEVTDGSESVSIDTGATQATVDASALGSPLTVRVAGLNRITGPGEWAEQEI